VADVFREILTVQGPSFFCLSLHCYWQARTSSPPGRLTDDSIRIESSFDLVSTFHRRWPTSMIRPTTTSPTCPM